MTAKTAVTLIFILLMISEEVQNRFMMGVSRFVMGLTRFIMGLARFIAADIDIARSFPRLRSQFPPLK